jgi:ABC-type dipeptide/oligopeptide/nickel transport system permease subunit
MLNDSRAYLHEAPCYGRWPGVALTILLIALNYVSDAMRDPKASQPIRLAALLADPTLYDHL